MLQLNIDHLKKPESPKLPSNSDGINSKELRRREKPEWSLSIGKGNRPESKINLRSHQPHEHLVVSRIKFE